MSELKLMASLPTIDIKGRPYVMVVERIKHFRRMFPEGSIETIIHNIDDKQVVMIARVYPNKKGNPQWFAEGIAQEYIGTSGINKTSWAEVCNTSAIGRALAMLGIGIEHSIASADEMFGVKNTKDPQYPTEKQKEKYQELLQHHVFVGRKNDMNNWWAKIRTVNEASVGLQEMQQKIDIYEQDIITKLLNKEK